MCNRHFSRWYRAGCPDPERWQAQAPPLAPDGPLRACRIGYCSLWTRGTSLFCYGHDTRWKNHGRPDIDEFTASCENPGPGQEHIDLRRLPAGLRLEMQYVLQCRSEEQDAKLPPREIHPFVAVLAGAGASSLLEQPEEWWTALHPPRKGRGWRPFILDARRRVEALAFGAGWATEYPRDIWRLCNLGIDKPEATISFAGIPQAWLRELAKRYTRWQLATGLSVSTAGSGARAVTRFAAWLAALPDPPAGLDSVTRPLLERYLAVLQAEMGGQVRHTHYVSGLSGFLKAVRRHGWDDTLPAATAIYPEDFPPRGARLPRGLAAHVMAQVEQPANLARQDNPACRLITVILIRCGLRISSAAGLAFDCTVTDADGAPYLRYYNTKMKREALVPVDDELFPADRRAEAAGAAALPRRRPGAVPPAERQSQRAQAHIRPHLPRCALPLAGRLRHPRRARAAGAPDPPSMEAYSGDGPDQPGRPAACRAEDTRSRLAAHDRSLCAAVR